MLLFNQNLLPYDGTVNYYGPIVSSQEAKQYFDQLINNIEWKNDEVFIFGKHIITQRKVAWYADAGLSYTYSKVTKAGLAWTNELLKLKALTEKLTGETFNSCLLNLYHHGEEGMGWHSDDEKELGKNMAIASLSFGADRKFSFKHKENKQTLSILLENGSLLLMKDETQQKWLHSLPKTKKITELRINLTFRTIMK